jgi:hypothetical protein
MCVPGMFVPQFFFRSFWYCSFTNSTAKNQLRVAFEAIFFRGQTIQEIIINDLRYIFVEMHKYLIENSLQG